MAKKQVKWNVRGFEDLRHEKKVKEMLEAKAEQIQAKAGGKAKGYVVTDLTAEDPRGAVSVMATGHALFSNRKHLSLLRALGDVRE